MKFTRIVLARSFRSRCQQSGQLSPWQSNVNPDRPTELQMSDYRRSPPIIVIFPWRKFFHWPDFPPTRRSSDLSGNGTPALGSWSYNIIYHSSILPRNGPGFDFRWKRCKNRASRPSQGTVNWGAVSKWPRCRWDAKHNQPFWMNQSWLWMQNWNTWFHILLKKKDQKAI